MKQNWTYKKLTDACDIQYGYPFNSAHFSDSPSDGMPLIRIRDVKDGQTSTYYKGDYPQEYIIHKGDYLIGMDGEFNIAPWKSDDALLNQRVCKISSKNKEVYVGYLYRFLSKELKKIEDETPFVTVKHLSAKRLNQVSIPVPPLSIQSRIVSELDLLQSIIDKQKAQLKELDTLAQSIFYDMFGDPVENEKGWEVKKFDELCTIITDGEHATPRRSESGIYLLSARNIQNHKLDLKDVDYIDTEEYNRIAKRITPQKGDVLISCSGSVGRVCIAPDIKFQMVRSVALLRLIDSVCSVFFEYLICSDYVQNQINNSKVQVAQANLFQGKIRALNAIVPPLSLQQSFANKIEAIEKQKSAISKSIAETEKLFDYTMDKYFG